MLGCKKFHVASDGSTYVSLTGTATLNGLCHTSSGNATDDQIVNCGGGPSDLAENFGTNDPSIAAGDVVVATGEAQEVTKDGMPSSKAWITKSSSPYPSPFWPASFPHSQTNSTGKI